VRLAAATLCLLVVGAVAITGACGLVARGYLMRQADQQLRGYAGLLTSHPFEISPLSRLAPGSQGPSAGAFSIEVRGPGGQLVLQAGLGPRPAPVLPAPAARAAAPAGQLVTATAGGGSWRVIAEPIHYQARRILFAYSPEDFSVLVAGHGQAGVAGTLVVGLDLASIGQAVSRIILTGLAVSGAAILVIACLTAALACAIRRPVAGGEPASGSGGQMCRTLASTCEELRRPLSVIHGLALGYRRSGPLSASDVDQTMARVTEEAQRMQALVADLPPAGHAGLGDPRA
jgi:hypothetical protein